MSKPIIEVRNLSKRYRLGAIGATSLREEASRYWDRLRGIPHPDVREFWALRDVSFDVHRGEVVGVIGRNGAGKSTLLKILSRITEPTGGQAILRGRVASLLEVGTGFHPELTGRENVFLNGAILGMTRVEVRRKFDEIVAFAEVDQFIDTPVKRYSSGMYVRLAFAVAAHLEPEILIVDEVLAVGDAAFQKKCLGKMQSVATDEGRTIFFVSHNMAAVQHLCTKGILLRQGRVVQSGPVESTVAAFLTEVPHQEQAGWHYRHKNPWLKVTGVELRGARAAAEAVIAGQALALVVHYECNEQARFTRGVSFSLTLKSDDRKITNFWSEYQPEAKVVPFARGTLECHLPQWPFREGRFTVDLQAHFGNELLEWIEDCVTFVSHDGDFYGAGRVANSSEGIVFIPHRWTNTSRSVNS
jgi:lipopolysaccharide transport system ATP-binding protein